MEASFLLKNNNEDERLRIELLNRKGGRSALRTE